MKSNIKWLLLKNNLTQEEAAKRLGYSKPMVNAWANANSFPKWDKAKKLADLLGCSIDELYEEESNVQQKEDGRNAKEDR